MYIFLLIVHVLVCLMLISVVLLQAGRGGGMSDMFGGGQPSSLFGTQTNVFLTRATEVCAVLFVVTSVGLGILTTRQSKSLMDRVNFPPQAASPAAAPKPIDTTAVPPSATAPVPAATSAAPAPVAPAVAETAPAAAVAAAQAPKPAE